jgi:hypothetical protein
VHVAGAIHRAHPAKTNDLLDQIALAERDARLKLALGNGVLFALIVVRKFGE